MGGKFERYFVPAVIGFAPFIMLLLTWAPDGKSPIQGLLLGLYLPIVAMELFVTGVALREGMVASMRRSAWPRLPTLALILLVMIAVVTAITAPNPGAARIWTSFWLVHLMFGFAVAHLCAKAMGRRDLVNAYLAGFATFMMGAALFAAQVTNPAFDWVHSWPAVTHIRHFGYYAAAMIGLCIGLAATERRRSRLAMLFAFATASFTFALWTGSRGTVIAVVGALLIGLVLVPAIRRLVVWVGTLLSLILGTAFASLLPAWGPLMGVGRTVSQTVDSGDVSTGRTQIWLGAIEAIKRRPIFGYGENQMSTVAPFGTIGQTHEIVLQILLAWGVAGLVCAAIVAVWFLSKALPGVRRAEEDMLPPFMAMVALAVLSTFDGALYHVIPVSIFAACAGMIASRWSQAKDA